MLDITNGIQSLTTFRRRSGDFMKQLKKTKRPVVLTVKGKAAAIVQDAEAYQLISPLVPSAILPSCTRRSTPRILTQPNGIAGSKGRSSPWKNSRTGAR